MSEDRLVRPLSLTMIGFVKEEGDSILKPKKDKQIDKLIKHYRPRNETMLT